MLLFRKYYQYLKVLIGIAVLVTSTAFNANPISTTRERLSVECMRIAAKQTFFEMLIMEHHPTATINDVSFTPFIGIYNDNLVAVFNGGPYHPATFDVIEEITIGGSEFRWDAGSPILVWNYGTIYRLAGAFHHGLLNQTELEDIHQMYFDLVPWMKP
jgi:hypothetical protein